MTKTLSKCRKCDHEIEYGICIEDNCNCVCVK